MAYPSNCSNIGSLSLSPQRNLHKCELIHVLVNAVISPCIPLHLLNSDVLRIVLHVLNASRITCQVEPFSEREKRSCFVDFNCNITGSSQAAQCSAHEDHSDMNVLGSRRWTFCKNVFQGPCKMSKCSNIGQNYTLWRKVSLVQYYNPYVRLDFLIQTPFNLQDLCVQVLVRV